MNRDRYLRIKQIFASAFELPADQRSAFLDNECGEDAALRHEVEELLASDSKFDGDAIGAALSDDRELATALPLPTAEVPLRIPGFKILRVCGAGGMGAVYEALQQNPARRVALKVIQSASLRDDLLSRFRRERDILGRLQHPGIAQIFAAGEFEQDGVLRPYFAMEFVEGRPLLEYTTNHGLDVPSKIAIFLRICEAMHYAHLQGVVHRDLKPDNIFVVDTSATATGGESIHGQPKILDFGVAQFVAAEQQQTMLTRAGQLVGSLAYMSPEQAAGRADRVDARTDVYGLGVVLYELLSGRLPHDVRDRPMADALQAIRDEDPSRLGTLDPGFRGDLETIVGQCLERDEARRYQSAAELAEDLRRFQEFEPILARPPSTWYQMRKFARRNRAIVFGVAATVMALAIGLVIAVVFAISATRSEALLRAKEDDVLRQEYRSNIVAASALVDADPSRARAILDRCAQTMRNWEWRFLSAKLSRKLMVLGSVHRGSALFALSGSEHVVAQKGAKEFGFWDVRAGRETGTLVAPAEVRVWTVAKDGSRLAAVLEDKRIVVADPRANAQWETWLTSASMPISVALTPDASRLAIVTSRELRVGDLRGWETTALPAGSHTSRVAMEFTGDGNHLVALLRDVLCKWEAREGLPIGQIESKSLPQGPLCLALSPNGGDVALGHRLREVMTYDVTTMQKAADLLGHRRAVDRVMFRDDGALLSLSTSGIRVWDVEQNIARVVIDAKRTREAVFVGDDRIVSITAKQLHVWSIAQRSVRVLEGHLDRPWTAAFSPDGGLLATSAPYGNEICVWDPLVSAPLRKLHKKSFILGFDRRGERLITNLGKGLWSGGGQPIAHDQTPSAHRHGRHEIGDLAVWRTEHGPQDDGGFVRAFLRGVPFKLTQRKPPPYALGAHPVLRVGEFCGHIAQLIVFAGRLSDADARRVESYLADRRAQRPTELPAVSGARLVADFRANQESLSEVDRPSRMWRAHNDPSLVLRSAGFGMEARLGVEPARGQTPTTARFIYKWGYFRWLESPLPSLAGETHVTVFWLGRYEKGTRQGGSAYSIGSRRSVFSELAHDPRTRVMNSAKTFSPDGRVYAATSVTWASQLLVRNVETDAIVMAIEGDFFSVAFHPDGKSIACGDSQGRVAVFEYPSGRKLSEAKEAHSGAVYGVAFSPDGARLASGGNDTFARIWNSRTLDPILDLTGHRSYVRSVIFSPDGSMLATTSGDHSVRVWDTIPPADRYRTGLDRDALASEVRGEVLDLHKQLQDADQVVAAIRQKWPADPKRRRAAQTVLAAILK